MDIKAYSVVRLDDGTVMIGCSVVIDADISYYLERLNATDVFDDMHPHVVYFEHNEYYLKVSNTVKLKYSVNYRTSKAVFLKFYQQRSFRGRLV